MAERERVIDGRLKLRHIVLVDALERQGSIVAAAAELYMTQPAATRSLRELEHIFGLPLFDRGPRGITPTEFGSAFVEHARLVLAQLQQARRHMQELASAEYGTAVVGNHLAGANTLIPHTIAVIKAETPRMTVIVREAMPDALTRDLIAGRVDLVIGRLTEPSDEYVVRHRLCDEEVALFAGAHHRLTRRRSVPIEDVMDFPWVLPGAETALRRELEEFFVRSGVALPANRVEGTAFLAVRRLLLDTDTVAPLPSSVADDDERLVRLPVSLGGIGHTFGYSVARGRALNRAAQKFISTLVAVAGSGDAR
jgi:DNA-binding transcriptional LysR family regulator